MKKHKVLIIDDEEIDLMLMKRLVIKGELHPSPTIYNDGLEALEDLVNNNPTKEPVLIFLDIHMPVFGGFDFMDMLQTTELDFPVKVVMVTSSVSLLDRNKAEKYPEVVKFFEKPLSVQQLKAFAETL